MTKQQEQPIPSQYPPYRDCGVHDSFSDGLLPIHTRRPYPAQDAPKAPAEALPPAEPPEAL